MTRRLEAGPLLVTLGALLLLVSLFLSWFSAEISAWEAFETWDVVLFTLALVSMAGGLGLTTQDVDLVDRRFLPAAVAFVVAIVASQIIDPPPAATGQDPDTGAWLALGGALAMLAGAVLTFGRVRLALTVERRDQRRHVSAVDARRRQEQTTDSQQPVAAPQRERQRLFARESTPETETDTEPQPAAVAGSVSDSGPAKPTRAGKAARDEKQD